MIYFFVKDRSFIQCEIHPGAPHVLTLIEPDGAAHTETVSSSEDLADRWGEMQKRLNDDGWKGPFGRDSRA